MKKLITFWFSIIVGIVIFIHSSALANEVSCLQNYTLTGVQQALINQEISFQVHSYLTWELQEDQVNYLIDKKSVHQGKQRTTKFESPWNFTVIAHIKTPECKGILEHPITIYDKHLVYLGLDSDFSHFWFEETLNKKGYFFTTLFTDKNQKTEFNLLEPFTTADVVIINDKDFQMYLEQYLTIKKTNLLKLKKQFIIVTDINTHLLKRSLAQYAKSLADDSISTISSDRLINLLSDLSLGKEYTQQAYITQFSWNIQNSPKWMMVSYLVDDLLKNGFPLQILAILLSLSVVALVISFCKQVIGIGISWVYHPIIFALIVTIAGLKIWLFFFGTAILANLLIKVITSRLYLLQNSRTSLLITMYILCFLWGVFFMEWLGFQVWEKSDVLTLWLIFPIFLSLFVTDKTFSHLKLFSKAGWINAVEFLFISYLSYSILKWTVISDFLLSYPESLLGIIIINFIIWRFSGLQVFEFIRFMPLIKKHLEDNEE